MRFAAWTRYIRMGRKLKGWYHTVQWGARSFAACKRQGAVWRQRARYHAVVIRRLYVHNFRCLENFELKLEGMPSVLLIGKNGSGKSTVGDALQILQQIGRGTSYVRALAKPADFARGRADVPMRFEVEVVLGPQVHVYTLALRLPDGEENLRVLEETYAVDGLPVFTRGEASKEQDLYQLENDVVALPLFRHPSVVRCFPSGNTGWHG